MNKRNFLFLATSLTFLFSCATVNTQKESSVNPSDIVRWSDTTRISWDDFMGTPPANTNLGSELIVQTPVEFQPPTYFDSVVVRVDCYLERNKSWVIKSKAKKQLLAYNQILFEIYEVSARNLRKILAETNFHVKDPVGVFNRIRSEHDTALEKTISQYNTETEKGEKTKKVMEWAEKMARELNVLEEFRY
jgi:hypothetical protein